MYCYVLMYSFYIITIVFDSIISIMQKKQLQRESYISQMLFCESFACVLFLIREIYNKYVTIFLSIVADIYISPVLFISLLQQEYYFQKILPTWNISSNLGRHSMLVPLFCFGTHPTFGVSSNVRQQFMFAFLIGVCVNSKC